MIFVWFSTNVRINVLMCFLRYYYDFLKISYDFVCHIHHESYTSFVRYPMCQIHHVQFASYVTYIMRRVHHVSCTSGVIYIMCHIDRASYASCVMYIMCHRKIKRTSYEKHMNSIRIHKTSYVNHMTSP